MHMKDIHLQVSKCMHFAYYGAELTNVDKYYMIDTAGLFAMSQSAPMPGSVIA